jgi:hypothetical protein
LENNEGVLARGNSGRRDPHKRRLELVAIRAIAWVIRWSWRDNLIWKTSRGIEIKTRNIVVVDRERVSCRPIQE